jgi:hypothetical protein
MISFMFVSLIPHDQYHVIWCPPCDLQSVDSCVLLLHGPVRDQGGSFVCCIRLLFSLPVQQHSSGCMASSQSRFGACSMFLACTCVGPNEMGSM